MRGVRHLKNGDKNMIKVYQYDILKWHVSY